MEPTLYAYTKGRKRMINFNDLLSEKELVDTLIQMLAENFPDFTEERQAYLNAMKALETEPGCGATSVQEEMAAVRTQTASNLRFCGWLGLKANLDHFLDPAARTFPELEPECYLREEPARRMPDYVRAQEVRDRFRARLSPAGKRIYEDASSYICYLETAGPRLAHYRGWLLGDTLLQKTVPGYHPDTALTERYGRILEDYFGKPLRI